MNAADAALTPAATGAVGVFRLRTQSKHLTVGVVPAPLLISGTFQEPRAGPDPNTPAGRGGLAGALAALPTVQLGIGDAPRCENLVKQPRKG